MSSPPIRPILRKYIYFRCCNLAHIYIKVWSILNEEIIICAINSNGNLQDSSHWYAWCLLSMSESRWRRIRDFLIVLKNNWKATLTKRDNNCRMKTLLKVGFHIQKQKQEKYVPRKPESCEIYVHLIFFPFLNTAQGWGCRNLWNIICLGPSLPLFILYVTGKQCPCLQLSFPLH